jgi:hypothetical protein
VSAPESIVAEGLVLHVDGSPPLAQPHTSEAPDNNQGSNDPARAIRDGAGWAFAASRAAQPAWCPCQKRDLAAHGGLTCVAVAEIRTRIEYGRLPLGRRLLRRAPRGWRA